MNWSAENIFMTPPITGPTINSVFLPPEFRIILYVLISFILVFGTLYFALKKKTFPEAFRKAVVIAFFVSGLLYAVHSDIGWTSWIIADTKEFHGLSTEEKLRKMDGILYDFIVEAKKTVTGDYQIYSSSDYFEHRVQYFLLPLHKRKQAPYIIVIADDKARFDSDTLIFTRGDVKIANVKPVLVFAHDAYILKRP